MKKKAVYAGSFDPPTNGHLYIIKRAAQLFDELDVAIGLNPVKQYTFSAPDRLALLRAVSKPYTNVTVGNLGNQLLVRYAQSIGARYVVRGIRSHDDYVFEHEIAMVMNKIAPEIEVVYMMPPAELAEVSSSLVKELWSADGAHDVVKQYVPDAVFEKMLQNKKTS